ncbi:hypothetical protein LJR084_004836 [Variovorax sp. LjRoot84]|uniref:hypothetical protein n=1 Tax=Variovorax sp. LjRoot84 TaxID=3342340 RepID=UPI003ECC7153
MTDHLRTIAVTVEESERGVFHWLLIESIDDPTGFTVLFGSAEIFGSWEDALDGGVATLKSLVADRTIGPRLIGENEDEDPEPIGRRMRRAMRFG